MPRTINANYSNGLTLTSAGDNPLSIAGAYTIASAAGSALASGLNVYWTIANAGHVLAAGTGTNAGAGLALAAGAALANGVAGVISGYGFGVTIAGAGTVGNLGLITAARTAGTGFSYTAPNFTATSTGLFLGGGTVGNAASGTISGGFAGVVLGGGGSVNNAGVIAASVGGAASTAGIGLVLTAGGTISNVTGGLISGGGYGLEGRGNAAVTLNNAGTIRATVAEAVRLFGGGTVTNAATGTIAGGSYGIRVSVAGGTVTNSGVISGVTSGGVRLFGGGIISNASGGLVTGRYNGVAAPGGAGTINNAGTLLGTFSLTPAVSGNYRGRSLAAAGAYMPAGGEVTNASSGLIQGWSYGVKIAGAFGTVINAGSIASTRYFTGAGIQLPNGGSVTNSGTGAISAKWMGVQVGSGAAAAVLPSTIVNQGTILALDSYGDGADLWLRGPTYVVNQAGASLGSGNFAIVFYDNLTVVNRGFIGGPNAITEGNTANAASTSIALRLEVAPGASFGGVVSGPATPAGQALSVLELLSGPTGGTINGFGVSFTGFGTIAIDNGANWTLGGTVAASTRIAFAAGKESLTVTNPGSIQGTIAGFAPGDTLALAGVTTTTGVSLSASGNVLTVQGTGLSFAFDPAQSFAGKTFLETVANGRTNITLSCFAAGTRIGTTEGPIAVEHLVAGMRAVTVAGMRAVTVAGMRAGDGAGDGDGDGEGDGDGGSAEIVWVGHRAVDCRRHADPSLVCPVRVRAGAFGHGVPSRDVRLSPDHAVFMDGALIPIRCLINGGSIVQEVVASVTYYHVELPEHGVILAEDLPVESYLEAGGRAEFSNGDGLVRLFPDFGAQMWDMAGCAPLVQTGPVLERARRRLAWVAMPAEGRDQAMFRADGGMPRPRS